MRVRVGGSEMYSSARRWIITWIGRESKNHVNDRVSLSTAAPSEKSAPAEFALDRIYSFSRDRLSVA